MRGAFGAPAARATWVGTVRPSPRVRERGRAGADRWGAADAGTRRSPAPSRRASGRAARSRCPREVARTTRAPRSG